MILRRIMEHVKHQNWVAVALDFVIVVSGVFIGIQVANWNEALADARRGEEFVQRLLVDLRNDVITRTGLVAYYDAVDVSAEKAIALLNEPSPDPLELVVNTYRATEVSYDPQIRATWDEIVSSGEIGLLPRQAVQGGLSLYYGVDLAEQTRQEITNSRLRTLVRSIIPHNIQMAIRAGCSDVLDETGRVLGFADECRVDVPDSDIAAAAEILKTDPELLLDLTRHISALATARNNLRGDIYNLGRAIDLLEQGDKAAFPEVEEKEVVETPL